jgi:hypothetical protein
MSQEATRIGTPTKESLTRNQKTETQGTNQDKLDNFQDPVDNKHTEPFAQSSLKFFKWQQKSTEPNADPF